MKLMVKLAITIALISLAQLSFAGEPERYRVELILFTQNPVQGDDEIWPETDHRPDLVDAKPLALESELAPLSMDTAEMGSIMYALQRSSLYQPLLHTVWEQPGWSAEEAQAIRIEIPFDAKLPMTIFSENAPVVTEEAPSIGAAWPAFMGPQVPEQDNNMLSGTITVSRARYLHADFDLIYREYVDVPVTVIKPSLNDPTETVESMETARQLVEIPMRQKRRMRSKERHYIDHPRLGALIEITPVEIEEEETPQPEEPTDQVPQPN